jgi:hypothetical protein
MTSIVTNAGVKLMGLTEASQRAIQEFKELSQEFKELEEKMMSSRLLYPGTPKPMVEEAEYKKARAVLDLLPAGVYLKCTKCMKWWKNSDITYSTENGESIYLCERCAA